MKNIYKNARIACIVIIILWVVHILNILTPMIELRHYGIQPGCGECWWNIFLSPFLHADFHHLIANSGALFALLTLSLSFSRKLTIKALLVIITLGGGCVWLFGSEGTIHIGASGVIFGLIGYLMFAGIFRKDWRALLISVITFFFYGGALYGLLIVTPKVSWSGHFFGFLSGVLAAWWIRSLKKR